MWKDNTPSQSELRIGSIRIVVTNHVEYHNTLVMHCYALNISCKPLNTLNLGEAKASALTLVKGILKNSLERISSVRSER